MLFLFLSCSFSYNNNLFYDLTQFNWIFPEFNFLFIYVFLYFLINRLCLKKNYLSSLFFIFLILICLAYLLFFNQFDMFAAFLVLSESIILVYIFFVFLGLNLVSTRSKNKFFFWPILIVLIPFNSDKSFYFNLYLNWFFSLYSSYNDLVSQYIYIYIYNPLLLLFIGLWLLIITLHLLFVFLSYILVSLKKDYFFKKKFDFVLKNQSYWYQLKKKSFLKFFD